MLNSRKTAGELGTNPHTSGAPSSQFPRDLTGFQHGELGAPLPWGLVPSSLAVLHGFNMAVSLCFLPNSGIICSVLVALKCMKGVLSGLQGSILTTASILLRISARRTEVGLNKTGNNSFDLETRLLGEIDGFLYLAVFKTQKRLLLFLID